MSDNSYNYHNNVVKRQEQKHEQKLKERGWGKYYRATFLHSDRDHRGIRREVAPYSVSSVHNNSATALMKREAKAREKLLIQRQKEQRIMRRQASRTQKALNQMQQAFETETGTSAPSSYDQLRQNQRTYVPKGRAGTRKNRKARDLADQRVQQEKQARKRFQRRQTMDMRSPYKKVERSHDLLSDEWNVPARRGKIRRNKQFEGNP